MLSHFFSTLKLIENSKIIKRGLLLLAIGSAAAQFSFFLPKTLNRTDPYRDVVAYYLVIKRVQNHQPIYTSLSNAGPHNRSDPLYLYPPFFASALSTLPKMSFKTFARFWTLLLYGAFWIYAATLGKLSSGKFTVSGTLIAGLILFLFPGTYRALELGQVDPLLWASLGLALSIPLLRGFSTMAIGIIKPWGIWPFLWSLAEGYRVLIGGVLVLTGSVLAGALVMGGVEFVEACRDWLLVVLPSLAQGAWSPDNRSLSFALLRFARAVGLWEYGGGILPFWARNWLLASSVTGPLLAGWCLRRKTKNLQLAVVGCTAILVSPICWTTYLPALLTLPAILFHIRLPQKNSSYPKG